MKLYGYWRSSATYRVRIALQLKALPYDTLPVSLIDGDQRSADYLRLNPLGLVPLLIDGGITIGQSVAILEYLEERYPSPPLLPMSTAARARVRELVNIIACDIHPLCNLRVLNTLRDELHADENQKKSWYTRWVTGGLTAIETRLAQWNAGEFCVGEAPTLADACLIPQLYNARRFGIPLEPYPHILHVDARCTGIEAFRRAAPERQPDSY